MRRFLPILVLCPFFYTVPTSAEDGTQARLDAAKAVLTRCDATPSGKADIATCVGPLRAIAAACNDEAATYQGLPNFAVCVPVYSRLLDIYGSYDAYAAAMKK